MNSLLEEKHKISEPLDIFYSISPEKVLGLHLEIEEIMGAIIVSERIMFLTKWKNYPTLQLVDSRIMNKTHTQMTYVFMCKPIDHTQWIELLL